MMQSASNSPCHQRCWRPRWSLSFPGHIQYYAVWPVSCFPPILLSSVLLPPGNKHNVWHFLILKAVHKLTKGTHCQKSWNRSQKTAKSVILHIHENRNSDHPVFLVYDFGEFLNKRWCLWPLFHQYFPRRTILHEVWLNSVHITNQAVVFVIFYLPCLPFRIQTGIRWLSSFGHSQAQDGQPDSRTHASST